MNCLLTEIYITFFFFFFTNPNTYYPEVAVGSTTGTHINYIHEIISKSKCTLIPRNIINSPVRGRALRYNLWALFCIALFSNKTTVLITIFLNDNNGISSAVTYLENYWRFHYINEKQQFPQNRNDCRKSEGPGQT